MVLNGGDIADGAAGRTVMVVDDDPLVLTLLKRWLESLAGHKVVESISAAHAMEVCRDYPGRIDLLISDVNLALGHGFRLAHQLADLRPGLPVLFISGADGAELAERGLLDRRAPFLQKPFGARSFLAVVGAMLA